MRGVMCVWVSMSQWVRVRERAWVFAWCVCVSVLGCVSVCVCLVVCVCVCVLGCVCVDKYEQRNPVLVFSNKANSVCPISPATCSSRDHNKTMVLFDGFTLMLSWYLFILTQLRPAVSNEHQRESRKLSSCSQFVTIIPARTQGKRVSVRACQGGCRCACRLHRVGVLTSVRACVSGCRCACRCTGWVF